MFVRGEATILHADADAFYASVEQRDDRRLRGRPVIVGAGVVLAASYEAKACGVRTAMGGAQARRLCPRAVVVPPRMSAYSEASKALFRVFEDTTPLVEGLSIDEAFLDVRGLRRLSGTPAESAVRLRREVRDRVAVRLGKVAAIGRGRRRRPRGRRRPRYPAHAPSRARRPHGRPSAALRRLLAGNSVTHLASADRRDPDRPRHGQVAGRDRDA